MKSRELRPGLWSVSVSEESRRVFGPVCYTEDGVQYHTYLLDTGEGWALFGAMPKRYMGPWLAEVAAVAGGGVKWMVLFGTEEDPAAARAVLNAYPEALLIGGTNTLFQAGGASERPRGVEVRSTRVLALGKKRLTLQVVPEKFDTASLYVLDKAEGVLLTADAFGSACACGEALVSGLADKEPYFRGAARYFADLRGQTRRKSLDAAVELVRDAGVGLICPARGPAVDAELDRLLAVYGGEAPEEKKQLTLALAYAPGVYMGELARAIARGVEDSGAVVVERFDLGEVNREEALRRLPRADAYLFGTPEVHGDAAKAVWDIVTSLRRDECLGKPAAVFTCANVVGHASENLRTRLEQLGCGLNWRDYAVQGRPEAQELENAEEYGFSIGCALQRIPNPRKPALVKCLVCGEVFDASLGVCPVCGVGLEQCVPADKDETAFRRDTACRYLILGGGVAAVSAAEAIRLRDRTGEITLLSAENYLPINRPMLTKDLATVAAGPEAIQIHDQAWYDRRELRLRLGVSAVSLDPEAKAVAGSDGNTYPYDKLIYATGAECFVPPFEGHDKPGVMTIRHLWDSETLRQHIEWAKQAVVIGGGVLGLEAASELVRAGLKVTVLEAAPQIIGRQVDAQSAAILRGIMEKMGVACHEGVSIAGIEGEKRTTGVRLADGRIFLADVVIVSCGNRPNIQAARAAGIAVDRSIVVNERMETSIPDIYACGDCCQMDGVNYQLWQEASAQGRTAGANAAGDRTLFVNQPLPLNLEGFGTALFAMGDPGKREDIPYRTVETYDGVAGSHEKYWFFGGSLEGVVVIGAPEKTVELSQAVSTHARYTQMFAK